MFASLVNSGIVHVEDVAETDCLQVCFMLWLQSLYIPIDEYSHRTSRSVVCIKRRRGVDYTYQLNQTVNGFTPCHKDVLQVVSAVATTAKTTIVSCSIF